MTRRRPCRLAVPAALWAAVAAYMALVFALSSAPLEDQGPAVAGAHDVVRGVVAAATDDPETAYRVTPVVEHVVVYEGLGALALAAWSSLVLLEVAAGSAAWRWALPLALVLVLLYGAFDEWHQGLVAGRTSSAADVAWDVVGGLMGAAGAMLVRSVGARDGVLRRWVAA